jgi:hypothetical protein
VGAGVEVYFYIWVAKTKSTQQPATRKPAPAHMAIRLLMELLLSAAKMIRRTTVNRRPQEKLCHESTVDLSAPVEMTKGRVSPAVHHYRRSGPAKRFMKAIREREGCLAFRFLGTFILFPEEVATLLLSHQRVKNRMTHRNHA